MAADLNDLAASYAAAIDQEKQKQKVDALTNAYNANVNSGGAYNDYGLSDADKANLNVNQQAQMAAFKKDYANNVATAQQYAAAGNAGEAQKYYGLADQDHAGAQTLRENSGGNYSGGDDGSGYMPLNNADPNKLTADSYYSYQPDYGMLGGLAQASISQSQAANRAAYDRTVNAANTAEAALPSTYNAQRNSAAAQSEVQRANFNEQAASAGLNSGAGSQASLAMSNALQGNLSKLGQAQADAYSKLEAQKTQAASDLQNANAEAASKAYLQYVQDYLNEYSNAQNSKVAASANQAQLDRAVAESNRNYNSAQEQAENSRQQTGYSKQLTTAWNYAKITGDYTLYGNLAGWTDDQITSANAAAALK